MSLRDRFPGFLIFLYICVYIYQFGKWDRFNNPVSIKKGITVLKLEFLYQDTKKTNKQTNNNLERLRMYNWFLGIEKDCML